MTFISSYNVCLRRESGYCAVEWSTQPQTAGDEDIGQFSVSDNYKSTGLAIADIKLGAACNGDYVTIPQGTLASNSASQSKDR